MLGCSTVTACFSLLSRLNSSVLTIQMKTLLAVLSCQMTQSAPQSSLETLFCISVHKLTREQGFLSYCLASLSIASLTHGVRS